jgi:hypothetical protein
MEMKIEILRYLSDADHINLKKRTFSISLFFGRKFRWPNSACRFSDFAERFLTHSARHRSNRVILRLHFAMRQLD